MAKSTFSGKDADKSLECSICFSDFTQPKQLPCLHTFCLICLQKYCHEKISDDKKPCPLCRRAFGVPQGGLEGLPNNEFIIRLLLIKQASEVQKKSSKCDPCAEIGEDVEAEAFCNECNQCLCLRCKKYHYVTSASKSHNLLQIEERPSEADLQKRQLGYCSIHPNKEIEFYCWDCHMLLCYVCHFEDHGKHYCKGFQDVVNQKKETFVKDEKELRRYYDKGCEQIKNLKQEREKALLEATKAIRSVEETFNNRVKILAASKDNIVGNLEDIKARRLKEIDSQEDLNQLHFTELDSFLAYSRMVMERGTDCEIIRVADELHKRAEELIKSQDERYKQQLPNCSIKFVPSPEPIPKDIEKSIGEIMDTEKSKWFVNSNMPMSLKWIEVSPEITGLTVVNNQIFSIIYGKPLVSVFDVYTETFRPNIKIPDMKEPTSIASCKLNKVLYISDQSLGCIHRVNLSDNTRKRWKVQENCELWGLSITSENHLLVTAFVRGGSRVLEYTSEDQLIRDIILVRGTEVVWQTVKLSSDEYLICQELREASLHRLCIINSKGEVIKSYDGDAGWARHMICEPPIAIHTSKGYVFVANCDNTRVLMFSRDLTLLGRVQIPDDALLLPKSIYFDSNTDRLFIGDWKRGGVLIFSPPE